MSDNTALMHNAGVKRREFLKAAAAAGAGLNLLTLGEQEAHAFPTSGPRAATVFLDQAPASPNHTDAGADYEVGMRFFCQAAGQITALRFYKAPSEAGAHSGRLWEITSTGPVLLATILFATETTTSPWQQQALPVPVPVRPDRNYVVSVNCNGRFPVTINGFSSPITRAGLTGTHGVFNFTPGAYPAQISSVGNNNYFVDVVYTPAETIFTTQTPNYPNLTDGVNYELGLIFRKPRRGRITAIRYWRSPSDTGAHVGRIWRNGVLLSTVAFVDEQGSGWQQQALASPLVIDADTDYVVSVNCNLYFPDTFNNAQGIFGPPGQFPTQSYMNGNYFRDVVFVPENPTYEENQKAGHTGWKITDYAAAEIAGYANAVCVNRGSTIELKVSVAANGDPYRIDLYRLGYYGGTGGHLYWTSGTRAGIAQPHPPPGDPTVCNWSTTDSVALDASWPSGIYHAKLTALASNKQSAIWFVIREDASRADILFQVNFTTMLAYNNYGGRCLYDHLSANGRAHRVSFDRPFSQASVRTHGAGDFLTIVNALEHSVLHLQYNMARWLEAQGYDVTYATNLEIHSTPGLLLAHKTFLSVGHDEYWSQEMRQNVEAARDSGVHLAFFSANTAYWRARFESSNRVMVCYKGEWRDDPVAPTNRFRSTESNNNPENAMLGIMYCGGTWNANIGFPFRVAANDHYFDFTGLQVGDTINGLVGFEWDTIFPNSPPGLITLGVSSATAESRYVDSDGVPPPGPEAQVAHMTRYQAASGAKVFAAGTIQWAYGLDSDLLYGTPQYSALNYESDAAKQITANVFNDMSCRPLTPAPRLIVYWPQ